MKWNLILIPIFVLAPVVLPLVTFFVFGKGMAITSIAVLLLVLTLVIFAPVDGQEMPAF